MIRPSRIISVAVGLCFVVLAMVWARAFYGSIQSYHKGATHLEKHQYIEAITFFDRSIHWYTPFNPYVRKSAEHLWEIGIRAEQEGDTRLALIAIRTIRQGFYAARSFYTPGKDWISRCDTKITSLTAKEMNGQQPEGKVAVPSARQQTTGPDIFWTIVLEAGFLGWIGSAIGFLIHALTGEKIAELRSKPALFWGLMVILFYALWIVGMMRA